MEVIIIEALVKMRNKGSKDGDCMEAGVKIEGVKNNIHKRRTKKDYLRKSR